jgi:hypothetical protein
LIVVEQGQIVEAGGDQGMALAQELPTQLQGLLVQRFRRLVASLRLVESGQMLRLVATSGWRSPKLPSQLQGLLVQRFRLVVAALSVVEVQPDC